MLETERYLLVLALSIFFGLLALSLVTVHEAHMKQQTVPVSILYSDCMQAQSADKLGEDPPVCYTLAELNAYAALHKSFVPYLTARLKSGRTESIYLDKSPDGNGGFFVTSTGPDKTGQIKACVTARGTKLQPARP